MTLTKTLIFAAGRDAGERSRRSRNLPAWDETARDAAYAETERLITAIGGEDAWMDLPK